MSVRGVGVAEYASVQDIKTHYDDYTFSISGGELQHFGEFETCLTELAEQTFLSYEKAAKVGWCTVRGMMMSNDDIIDIVCCRSINCL